MSKDIIIAGENGEFYHITEDELRKSHRVPQDFAKPGILQSMAQEGKMSLYLEPCPEAEDRAEWAGGCNQVSGCSESAAHFLNLGITETDD